MIEVTAMPRSAADWLHPILDAYYRELVPGAQALPKEDMKALWDDPTVTLLTIHAQGEPVGFAIIEAEDAFHTLSEICVLPDHRGRGIGTQAVARCLQLHPGAWALDVANAQPGSARFWDRVLTSIPGISSLERGPPHTPHQSHSFTFTYEGAP